MFAFFILIILEIYALEVCKIFKFFTYLREHIYVSISQKVKGEIFM